MSDSICPSNFKLPYPTELMLMLMLMLMIGVDFGLI
jgi:hypothetical protein